MLPPKKIFKFIFLFLLINLSSSLQATDHSVNYLKGKFYESVKDNFLVATNQMRDPKFKKTVITILENDENGAWGLVINKTIGLVALKDLINPSENLYSDKKNIKSKKIPIYWGGPVDRNRIFILHSNEYESESTIKFNKISVSTDLKTLFKIAENKGPKNNLVIVGISSWGPGQLEGEMEREGWVLSEIKTDLIFKGKDLEKWKKAIKNSFIKL
tara:strand:- start:547 stop:1191 length:645 start_codon:yes stop_codon:yes gene_type:complete